MTDGLFEGLGAEVGLGGKLGTGADVGLAEEVESVEEVGKGMSEDLITAVGVSNSLICDMERFGLASGNSFPIASKSRWFSIGRKHLGMGNDLHTVVSRAGATGRFL